MILMRAYIIEGVTEGVEKRKSVHAQYLGFLISPHFFISLLLFFMVFLFFPVQQPLQVAEVQ